MSQGMIGAGRENERDEGRTVRWETKDVYEKRKMGGGIEGEERRYAMELRGWDLRSKGCEAVMQRKERGDGTESEGRLV